MIFTGCGVSEIIPEIIPEKAEPYIMEKFTSEIEFEDVFLTLDAKYEKTGDKIKVTVSKAPLLSEFNAETDGESAKISYKDLSYNVKLSDIPKGALIKVMYDLTKEGGLEALEETDEDDKIILSGKVDEYSYTLMFNGTTGAFMGGECPDAGVKITNVKEEI